MLDSIAESGWSNQLIKSSSKFVKNSHFLSSHFSNCQSFARSARFPFRFSSVHYVFTFFFIGRVFGYSYSRSIILGDIFYSMHGAFVRGTGLECTVFGKLASNHYCYVASTVSQVSILYRFFYYAPPSLKKHSSVYNHPGFFRLKS